jgi:hypothetical protein
MNLLSYFKRNVIYVSERARDLLFGILINFELNLMNV